MSNPELRNRVSVQEAMGFSLLLLFGSMFIQATVLAAFVSPKAGNPSDLNNAEREALMAEMMGNATALSVSMLMASILCSLLLWQILRARHIDVKEVLHLKPFQNSGLVIWTLIMLAVLAVFWVIGNLLSIEESTFMSKAWEDSTNPLLLILAVVIAAPVFEELVFRGLLFEGMRNSALGTGGAIVLTAAIWSLIHMQYAGFENVLIFALGIVLAVARLATHSIYVPIFMHAVNNGIALFVLALNSGSVAQ